MDLRDEIERIQVELAQAEREAINWRAKAAGLRAQLAELENSVLLETPEQDLEEIDWNRLPRTQAIIRILNHSTNALSIGEIEDGLSSVGRSNDPYGVIAATLQMLLHSGRVERPSRGLYRAARRPDSGLRAS